jgi:hypothetical protein
MRHRHGCAGPDDRVAENRYPAALSMIVFGLLLIALVALGTELVRILWRRIDPAGAADTATAELLSAGALVGIAAWLAINWVLALTHTLHAASLWTGAGVILAITALVAVRRLRTLVNVQSNVQSVNVQIAEETFRGLIYLLPLAFWLVFILWRGLVLPPASHDALSYHLPKAVLLERAGGWEVFQAQDGRITKYPFNYELLLADVMILGDTDAYTEWIATVFWLLLLMTTAAMATRWWRARFPAMVAVMLAVAASPILILESGAHKNDLLVAWFSVCALLWGSRWVVRGGRVPMFLMILALGCGLGTKATIVATAAGLAPFVLLRTVRELRRRSLTVRDLLATAITGILAFVLGGGVTFLLNLYRLPNAADVGHAGATVASLSQIAWGDWNNLWQVPYLLLTIPFSANPDGVWVPWSGQYWFWPHYEIYFSHYGRLFSFLVLALPFVLRRYGRGADRPTRMEWKVAGCAAVTAIVLMLPTVLRPLGFFGAFARLFVFIVPVVVCLTIPPLIQALSRRMSHVALAALAAVFLLEAGVCAVHDRFAPLDYALWASENPGTRFIYFDPNRAGSVVDRLAGPHDKIAIDAAFDTWIYPAYGARRTRAVILLPPDATPDTIPPDIRWVIVDRSWNALWNHPKLKDLSKMGQYIGRGTPAPEDIRLFQALRQDSRFQLVFRRRITNQAVFRRITPSAPVPPQEIRRGTMPAE